MADHDLERYDGSPSIREGQNEHGRRRGERIKDREKENKRHRDREKTEVRK